MFGQDFTVQTDHQPLVQLTTKPLCEVSPRLQQLLLKVTQYKINTIYVKHDGVPVAGCLSQNVQAESALEDKTINVTVAAISMFQEGKINQIKWETSMDLTLVKLAEVVQTGWPDQCAEIDQDLHAFWIHRWNLSIVDGVIMNGTRIVQHASPSYDEHCVEVCYPSHIFGSDIANVNGKPHVVVVDLI